VGRRVGRMGGGVSCSGACDTDKRRTLSMVGSVVRDLEKLSFLLRRRLPLGLNSICFRALWIHFLLSMATMTPRMPSFSLTALFAATLCLARFWLVQPLRPHWPVLLLSTSSGHDCWQSDIPSESPDGTQCILTIAFHVLHHTDSPTALYRSSAR
jgi:hypothetical protein